METKKYLLGLDVGSSSVKASILEIETGNLQKSVQSPDKEMPISSPQIGWAEQNPEMWWMHVNLCLQTLQNKHNIDLNEISAVGISYQMHGLVLIDKDYKLLRPAIIWCDSRAIETGAKAFDEIGHEKCLSTLLNSPGNFTAAKLKWIKENEPRLYEKAYKFMLPGDYIAMKLTGEVSTTSTGLSEGAMWNFHDRSPALFLFDHLGISKETIPSIKPVFSIQGSVTDKASLETGLTKGIPVSYRAGDQPNNAFSLNVNQPGEIAATAGTSGVIYAITDQLMNDPQGKIHFFQHVNDNETMSRIGILACLNGSGIFYSWLRKILSRFSAADVSYEKLNDIAAESPPGALGMQAYPFGNGAERLLNNLTLSASFQQIQFNNHSLSHLIRASQESIAFSLNFAIRILSNLGLKITTIKAGNSNLFLSSLFKETLSTVSNAVIEIYDTDGSQGAARGAGIGAGFYQSTDEAFQKLICLEKIIPDNQLSSIYQEIYLNWENHLTKL